MDQKNKFIIRVYGIFINQHKEVLLSDEYMLDTKMTKFPGGGMHFGEGTKDCLAREIKEEMNGQEIEILEHFYTTDYYQPAYFYDNYQVISIYYLAQFIEPIQFIISKKPFDFPEMKNGSISFRWKILSDLNDEELTFPIDKLVGQKLKIYKPKN